MNPETPPLIAQQAAIAANMGGAVPASGQSLKRLLTIPLKVFWGMIFAQSILGGLLILGWTQRFMQLTILAHWRNSGNPAAAKTFDTMAWPNWFAAEMSPMCGKGNRATQPTGLSCLLGSFFINLKLGLQGFFNVALFTLPGCVLMSLGWYDGWQNSFNKGYESFYVGIAVSWLGILLFIAAMFYVPMAQARQASTGRWKSFYQFKFVWTIVRRQWLSSVGLAALYSIASLPWLWLSAAPMYFPQIADSPKPVTAGAVVVIAIALCLLLGMAASPLVIWRLARKKGRRSFTPWLCTSVLAIGAAWTIFLPILTAPKNPETFSPSQIRSLLGTYYFWAAPVFLTAFVFLRWMAARIYAAGILKAVQSGAITKEMLSENEWQALHQLDLLRLQPERPRHFFVKFMAWTGTRAGRVAAGFATALLWFTFVGQIYIRFFINHPGAQGWLDQPVAQLPWFRPLPARLHNFWGELFATAFVIFVGWLGFNVVQKLRRFFSK